MIAAHVSHSRMLCVGLGRGCRGMPLYCMFYSMTPTSSVQPQVLVHVHVAVGVGVGQKADLQGLDDGNAFNGARNPIRCLVYGTLHCNSAPPSEIRAAGMGTTRRAALPFTNNSK